MHKSAVFIFRRDLRIQDNTGLIAALKHAQKVHCCFIFDPRQIDKNEYRSHNALQFMLESLQDLSEQLQEAGGVLNFFYGKPEEIVPELDIDAVYYNKDYTPFSLKRDTLVEQACKQRNIAVHTYHDALLNPPGTVLKENQEPYSIFTPFYKAAQIRPIKKPVSPNTGNLATKKISDEQPLKIQTNQYIAIHGGRKNALAILKKTYTNYKENRDYPTRSATTHLSAHNKFGTVSIREVYWALTDEELRRQLYWRDFFTHIAHHYPKVFGHAFQAKFDGIKWKNDKKLFKFWCEGRTGFPIIDAGMRELAATGYMHNRVRMIVASFLVKDLHIDWQWGEKYFAQQLIDYDPAVNNGSWQWAASTGCDAQPYFRIFNPWLQQKKFDADCAYIKKWIPELAEYAPKVIHNLEQQPPLGSTYPNSIVDHKQAKQEALKMFTEN